MHFSRVIVFESWGHAFTISPNARTCRFVLPLTKTQINVKTFEFAPHQAQIHIESICLVLNDNLFYFSSPVYWGKLSLPLSLFLSLSFVISNSIRTMMNVWIQTWPAKGGWITFPRRLWKIVYLFWKCHKTNAASQGRPTPIYYVMRFWRGFDPPSPRCNQPYWSDHPSPAHNQTLLSLFGG